MNYLDIQIATVIGEFPADADFQTWVDTALQGRNQDAEVVIRLVDEPEMTELNQQYRHKSGPTNILSFPFEAPPGVTLDLLGDLVICAPLIISEAAAQSKPVMAHWAHITVHGVLHLLGYDHIQDAEAAVMEALEVEILSKLNIANPYLEVSMQ